MEKSEQMASGANKRDVWTIGTRPFKGAHFATMPEPLVEICLLAGCPTDGLVLDPFMGAGTVGVVARRHSRHYLGIELNETYIALAQQRIAATRQPVLLDCGGIDHGDDAGLPSGGIARELRDCRHGRVCSPGCWPGTWPGRCGSR